MILAVGQYTKSYQYIHAKKKEKEIYHSKIL